MITARKIPLILAMLCLLTAFWTPLYAQLVIPEVNIDTQRLPEEARTKLVGLDSILTLYLQNQEWARDDYQYDYPIQINIYFTDYTPDPAEDRYKAKLIVTNKQDVRLEDTRWELGLRTPPVFRPGEFQSFKSLVEFYVWILVGLEIDRLEKLGGNPYYEKAKQIDIQGSTSPYYFGWDKRLETLRALQSDQNQNARELNFFYYTGIYFDDQKDYKQSKDYLYYALVKLDKVPIDIQNRFLEVNHRQFAEALVRAGYVKGVRALMQLDPTHRAVYESIAPEGKDK
jgi:hypothetical protein